MWACRYTDINTSMLSFKQEPLFAYSGAWKLPRPTQKPTNHNRYNSCNIQLRLLYCCIWFRIVTGSGLMIHICYPWHGDSLRVFKKGISTFELFKLGKENLETGCLVIMIWLECELIQIVLIWYNNMLMHCNAIFVSKSVNLSFKIPPICFSHTCQAPALPSGAVHSTATWEPTKSENYRKLPFSKMYGWPQWLPLWPNCTFLLKSDVPLKARLDTGSITEGKMRSGNTGGLAQHCIFPVLPTSSSALFCIISQCSVTWRYIPILLQV